MDIQIGTPNTINIEMATLGGGVTDVKQNGTSVVSNHVASVTVPTKTSDLTNDSGFIDNTYHDSTKQDTLVSGTNIKTINNTSILGSGNLDIDSSQIFELTSDSESLDLVKVIYSNENPLLNNGCFIYVHFNKMNKNPNQIKFSYTPPAGQHCDMEGEHVVVRGDRREGLATYHQSYGLFMASNGLWLSVLPSMASDHNSGLCPCLTDEVGNVQTATKYYVDSVSETNLNSAKGYAKNYTNSQIDIVEAQIPTKTSDLTNDSNFITPSALNSYRTSAAQDIIDATKQDTLVSGTNIKTINNNSIVGSGNLTLDLGNVYYVHYGNSSEAMGVRQALQDGKLVVLIDINGETLALQMYNNLNCT